METGPLAEAHSLWRLAVQSPGGVIQAQSLRGGVRVGDGCDPQSVSAIPSRRVWVDPGSHDTM